MENVESHHRMSKSIVFSADGTEDETISTDSMEMDPYISQSCVLSMETTDAQDLFNLCVCFRSCLGKTHNRPDPWVESTDAQPISTHPVQPVEIRLFIVKSGLYAALDSLADALLSALVIVAVDFSRISALTRILPGHQYVQSGRYRLPLKDFARSSHRFSELHHQAPYMFRPVHRS
jgi:hypothetical protein